MVSSLLVVDDEAAMRRSLARLLSGVGYAVRVADCARMALGEAQRGVPDLVLLDVCLPDASGLEVLARLKRMNRRVVVIVMTAYESTRDAVLAMKRGAYDYLSKPFNIDAVRLLVKRALTDARHRESTRAPGGRSGAEAAWQGCACDRMVGASPAMSSVLDFVHRLPAGSPSNVLIDGETGTGKELLARAIHETSARAADPFVAVSCGAIPRELIESELFGYDPGAFTGARREGRRGAFERAGAGTIFLDEIGEMDPDMQVRLLRVLEAREFSRVGGQEQIPVKARVIAATNKVLSREVDRGRFRADLYFRLNVVAVTLPPLRERGGDVMLLAEAFLNEFNSLLGKGFKGVSPAARRALEAYPWPGNVRELRNVVERIISLETGEEVTAEHVATCLPSGSRGGHGAVPAWTDATLGMSGASCRSCPSLPPAVTSPARPGPGGAGPTSAGRVPREASASPVEPLGRTVEQDAAGKTQLLLALERTGGNVARAARFLGLGRGAVRYRMGKMGIARSGFC